MDKPCGMPLGPGEIGCRQEWPPASAWHYLVSLYAYGINVPSVSTSDGKQCGKSLGLGPSLWAVWYKMRQHFSGMLTLNID